VTEWLLQGVLEEEEEEGQGQEAREQEGVGDPPAPQPAQRPGETALLQLTAAAGRGPTRAP